MGKDIYEAIKPEQKVEKQKKVKAPRKPINKDGLIIGIVVAVIILLTAGIVAYYFWGVNSEVLVEYKGGEITRGEYEAVYRYWAPQLVYYGYDSATVSDIIVDEILLNQVIYDKAVEAGYTLSEEDKATTDEQFADEDSVTALRTNGINPDILKEFFYKNSVVSAYLADVQENATTESIKASIIAAEGEDADLNLYKTRHILIQVAEDATDADKATAKKEAQSLLAKIKKGSDFATLAEKNSDDTGTASEGGAFDMVNSDLVDEDYRNAVLKLKAGQLHSTVVESDFGYFIIKLESIEKNGRLTNDSDVQTYVNDFIEKTITAVFDSETEENKAQLEKVALVAAKLNGELGIATTTDSEE